MILEEIRKEQKEARLTKDKFRAGILTTLMAEIEIIGINGWHRDVTDEEAVTVITKFLKNLKETFKIYTNGIELEEFFKVNDMETPASSKKIETILNMTKEAEIYKRYLPTQMTEGELEAVIGVFMGDNANVNMGQIMGYLNKNFKGQYDGKMASTLIRSILS